MSNYERFIHEQDNNFLSELATLASSLQQEHLVKVIQILMQVVLNYNYDGLSEKDFLYLFNRFTAKQKDVLQTNNEQVIINYA